MRRYLLLLGAALLTAAFAVGAVACDDDEDGSAEATATDTSAEQPTDTAGSEAPTATSEDAGATADTVDVTLAAVGASGVSGSATLTPTDAGFDVEVTVDGGLEEGSHLSHIHSGTCASPGAPETNLTNVEANASGAGTASTSIAAQLSSAQDGAHYVAVHDLAGTVVTCGDIPTAS